ncbi:hypothetical protein B5G09_11705 [Alistipes sp. An54]|uniref:hypothetical protein n=1 Tax=Alistipes sp. An54 TaxID=1965645 RepID=UPI000B56F7E2|nr:hypothetical protein [Alistipes sp. An54]OUN76002.1 hypothetical protein B5G09_11705 [Alistipes sp. An54]
MKRTLIYIATLCAAFACTASEPEIRTGDLLFEVGATSEMSGAITAATGDDTQDINPLQALSPTKTSRSTC